MTRRTRRATRQAESRSGEEENTKTMKEQAEHVERADRVVVPPMDAEPPTPDQVASLTEEEARAFLSTSSPEVVSAICRGVRSSCDRVLHHDPHGARLRSQEDYNLLTRLATISALVLTNRHQDNEEEEEGKGEWFLDLHEAALMMHNKILLQNHQPGFQETETNENNEEDQVVVPGAEEILLCEDAVATLCESWVLHPRPPKAVASRSEGLGHALAARTLPWLLVQALTRGSGGDPGSWCRRASAFALRTLHLFDWCDDSALSLKRLLLRSMFCPPMVRTKQGRKMLAAAFALDPAFTSELEAVIRNQLLSGRKSLADHYGEILHTAWRSLSSSKKKKKTGEEEVDAAGRAALESRCLLALEDGVFPALVASCLGARTQRLAEMLRRTLRAAMYDRRSRCVATETLICETHEPLVFRSLCSPNAQVRANAMRLLSECFPLVRERKANASLEEWKRQGGDLLRRQADAMVHGLQDPVPECRAEALRCLSVVLAQHWHQMPRQGVKEMVNAALDLCQDASAAAVRAAAVRSLASLADCAAAHDACAKVLPKALRGAVTDSSPRVRQAALDALIKVSRSEALSKVLPWHECCEVEVLVSLLAQDRDAGCVSRLARLLLDSYVPSGEQASAMVMALLVRSPEAGSAFLRSACVAGMDGEVAARVCRELAEHLVVASEESGGGGGGGGGRKRGTKRGANGDEAKEQRERQREEGDWCRVVGGIESLATSLLEGGRRGQALLLGAVEGLDASLGGPGLVRLHAAAPTPAARARVIGLCSRLPREVCAGLYDACVSNAFGAPLAGEEEEPGATPPQLTEESAESLRALCRWGRAGDVLRRASGGIRRASVATTSATTSASGTPGAKRVCRRVEEEEGGRLTGWLDCLACLLAREDTRRCLAVSRESEEACEALGAVLRGEAPAAAKAKACSCLARLALHRAREAGDLGSASRALAEVSGCVMTDVLSGGEGSAAGEEECNGACLLAHFLSDGLLLGVEEAEGVARAFTPMLARLVDVTQSIDLARQADRLRVAMEGAGCGAEPTAAAAAPEIPIGG